MINDLPPRPAQREGGAGAPLSDDAAADETAPVSSRRRLMINDLLPTLEGSGADQRQRVQTK